MKLTLRHREARRLIEQRVRSGGYRSAEHVVTALFCLEQQERASHFRPGQLDALVAVGLAEDAGGEMLDGEQVLRELKLLRTRAAQKAHKTVKRRSSRSS
jgi:hypothetical protein